MKKLNNKGMTTVEVLICFVLVVIVTVSVYATVSSFNEKKIVEGYKEKIYNYKNLLTQDIQDDFIKIGLTHAKYDRTYENMFSREQFSNDEEYENHKRYQKVIHTVDCTLRDGSRRKLVIEQFLAASSNHPGGAVPIGHYIDDYYMIKYGNPDDLIDRDLPDLGHSGYDPIENKICDVDDARRDINCNLIQDLSINNVMINISDDNVLSIYIGFYHPDLGTKYAINIVCPIDYVSGGSDSSSSWNY